MTLEQALSELGEVDPRALPALSRRYDKRRAVFLRVGDDVRVATCWATGCLHRTATSWVRTRRELELTVFGLFVFLMARWSTARRDRGPAGAVVGVMARAQAVTAHRGSRRSAWRSSSWGEEPSIGELVE